jgi:Uma2 family endonuclease
MSTPVRRIHHSYAEYLDLEETSSTRHEFLDGEIYAMAGGTPDHAALAAAVLRALGARLPVGCRAFTSDLRVRVVATGLATYPDGAVICGKTQRAPDDPIAVTNPIILVEVTSHSTEEYDRGEKLRHYQQIDTLRDVLVVSHRRPEIAHHRRAEDGRWVQSVAVAGQGVALTSVGAQLSVDDIYRDGLEDAAG